MALSPGQNGGEAAYAPGCDTANIWNGYPGQPYTWDSDSHTLPLAGATLPATLTDPQLRGGFRYLTLFLSSDNTLNKTWYAGAYTVRVDTSMSNTAKSWPYSTGEADHADAQVPQAGPAQE